MGIWSHLISFSIGVYSGLYLAKNYNVPDVPEPEDIVNKIKKYLEDNKKDKKD